MEDGADAQEEAPEDGPQLRDQVELHHFTQVGVVAGSMGLELEKKEKVRKCKLAPRFNQATFCMCFANPSTDVPVCLEILRLHTTKKGRAAALGCVGAAGRPRSSQQGVKQMCREAIVVFTDVCFCYILLHLGAISLNYKIAFRQINTICSTKICFNNFPKIHSRPCTREWCQPL